MNVRQVIPRDAIPSVDDPQFVELYAGEPDDRVIVLAGDGEDVPRRPRAYPVRYLHYHEIVNDVLEAASGADETNPDESDTGRPVAVTWCPLCGSAVAYDRRVGDRTLTFGVSGKLADDDLVMYDRETGSEWKQSLGEAIAGPLAGTTLSVLPAPMTTWRQFHERYPEGVVLAPPGGQSEAAGDDADPEPVDYDVRPYREYFETEGFGLAAHRGEGSRKWTREDLGPKAVVLGIERGDEALGFPVPVLEDSGGVVATTVGGLAVVVVATDEGVFAFETPDGSDEGQPTLTDDGRLQAAGTIWDPVSGAGGDGRRLDPVPARRLFAFAWQDDHGPDSFYGLEGP